MATPSRSVLFLLNLAFQALYMVLVVWAWGDWETFWRHPARVSVILISVVASVGVTLCAPVSLLSSGKREDRNQRLIFLLLPATFLFAYLPPYADRRDLLVLDGEAVRYAGVVIFIVG